MVAMKNRKVELTAGGKTSAEGKIQRAIFEEYARSPFLFVIAMMSLSYIHRKCSEDFEFTKSKKKINHLIYVGDIELFPKKFLKNGEFDTNDKHVHPGYRNRI